MPRCSLLHPGRGHPYGFGRIATAIIRAQAAITLAGSRDELHTSRKFAQALLEHCDADRLTHRRPFCRKAKSQDCTQQRQRAEGAGRSHCIEQERTESNWPPSELSAFGCEALVFAAEAGVPASRGSGTDLAVLTARLDVRSGLIRCRERLYRRKARPVQRLACEVRPIRAQIAFLVARCHLRSPSGRSRQAYRAFLRTSCRRLGTASRGPAPTRPERLQWPSTCAHRGGQCVEASAPG